MSDCNCFVQRLKCTKCMRDVDLKDYNPWEHWQEPVQLELEIPDPQHEILDKSLAKYIAKAFPEEPSQGFFNSRDIPAI